MDVVSAWMQITIRITCVCVPSIDVFVFFCVLLEHSKGHSIATVLGWCRIVCDGGVLNPIREVLPEMIKLLWLFMCLHQFHRLWIWRFDQTRHTNTTSREYLAEVWLVG